MPERFDAKVFGGLKTNKPRVARTFSCIALLGAALAVLSMSACVRSSSRERDTADPAWFRWGVDRFVWDGRTPCREDGCAPLATLSMRGLTALESTGTEGNFVAVPSLAEEWKAVSPAEMRFVLREGALWSDGTPLVAADFVVAWTRLLGECKKNPRAALLFPIVGAKALCDGDGTPAEVGLSASDARTLVVKFDRPSPRFVRSVAHPALWPWREGAWLGPFLPSEREKNGRWRFLRNPFYAGAVPALGGVELRLEPSLAVRLEWMREGQIDLIDPIPEESTALVEGWEPVRESERVALLFNASKKPFHLLALRRAFARSIEVDELSRLLRWPNLPTGALVAKSIESSPLVSSVSEAKQAIAAAHWDVIGSRLKEGEQWRALARPSLAWNEGRLNETIAENLSVQWLAGLGERIDVLGEIGARLLPTLNPAFVLHSYVDDPYLVDSALGALLKVGQEVPLRWKSKALDVEIEALAKASTELALETIEARIERLLTVDEVLALPLYGRGRAIVKSKRVGKLPVLPRGAWDFARAELTFPGV